MVGYSFWAAETTQKTLKCTVVYRQEGNPKGLDPNDKISNDQPQVHLRLPCYDF